MNTAYVITSLAGHPTRRLPFDSLYNNVKRIPPGANAILDGCRFKCNFDWLKESSKSGATLRDCFLDTLNALVAGKEPHVYLSGGLDSANIVAGLKVLGKSFTAHHFKTSQAACQNVSNQERLLGFNLNIVDGFNKKLVNLSSPVSRSWSGIMTGCRPRNPIQLDQSWHSNDSNIFLHGQNADALLTVHDSVISPFAIIQRRGLKKNLHALWSRLFLTSAAISAVSHLGVSAREQYVKGLVYPGTDSAIPFLVKQDRGAQILQMREAKKNSYFGPNYHVGKDKLESFDVKLVRWLEYASHAQEAAMFQGKSYVYSSGAMFPHLLSASLPITSIMRPKTAALNLYRDLTGQKYESVVVTGANKVSEGKGLPRDPNEGIHLRSAISLVNWDLISDVLEPWGRDYIWALKKEMDYECRENPRHFGLWDGLGVLISLTECLRNE